MVSRDPAFTWDLNADSTLYSSMEHEKAEEQVPAAMQWTDGSTTATYGDGTGSMQRRDGQRDFLDGRAKGSEGGAQVEVEQLRRALQQAQANLHLAQSSNKTLVEKCRVLEQDMATQQRERLQSQAEKQLQLQLESVQSLLTEEEKRTELLRRTLAQLQGAYNKLSEENNWMKAEGANAEKSTVEELQNTLAMAEQALAAKQNKIDAMQREFIKKNQELESISVFQAQAEVYMADFLAEREAREKIHTEKEKVMEQLAFLKEENRQLKEENRQLKEELESQSANRNLLEMRNRHQQTQKPLGGTLSNIWQWAKGEPNIQEHTCPKCEGAYPDLDSLQIHIMDCIV
ncbi:optineurin-like [Conger conger]|uniref:optineurin-like n=1 Tax=Conger conger TaxID=82655 RepID=UPI002A59EEBB|nr:optineurin-like [Conger conger]